MGIRAVGFLPNVKDNKEHNQILSKFREDLFRLGAFGFDSWRCKITSFSPNGNAQPSVDIISFSDSSDVISVYDKDKILIMDSSFQGLLKDVGLPKPSLICRVEGAMAQLGDFKVRYGTTFSKDKPTGIIFDIEYLPVVLLTDDFQPLFDSVFAMMSESNQINVKLKLPPPRKNDEYTLKDLGILYNEIKSQIVPSN